MLQLLILFSLVVYRIVRFLISDSLIEGTRLKLGDWILAGGKDPAQWRDKLYEFMACPYCLSIWASAGVVGLAQIWVDVPLPWLMWLAVSGGCMVVWRIVETMNDD